MASFRKKRSRKYKRRNTRRNTRRNMRRNTRRNMRKSHIKRRGKKSLVGGLNISEMMRKFNASITMPKMLSGLKAAYEVHLDSNGTIQLFSTKIKQLCSNLLSIQPQKIEELIKKKNEFIIYLHQISLDILEKQLDATKELTYERQAIKEQKDEQQAIIDNVRNILLTEETTHEDEETTHEDEGIDKYSYYKKVKKKDETIINDVKTLQSSTNPLIIYESVNDFCRLTQKFIENYMKYYKNTDKDWSHIISLIKAKVDNRRILTIWDNRMFESAKHFAKIMYELLQEERIVVTNEEFTALMINLNLFDKDKLLGKQANFAWWEDNIDVTAVNRPSSTVEPI